jgi:hypothetical protein
MPGYWHIFVIAYAAHIQQTYFDHRITLQEEKVGM